MYTIKEKENKAFEALKSKQGYTNPMEAPRLRKVVVSVGIGSQKDKKRGMEVVSDRLMKITGQKAASRAAKKSIASFKTRIGDPIGYQVTMRGPRMYGFLEKLLGIALPRTKDFRGISPNAIDEMGNINIGIREHVIFPETTDEELRDVFGMAVTVVTSAKNKDEARAFLEYLGFPLKKDDKDAAPKRKKR